MNQLNIPIQPNRQFATLADQCTIIAAIGEIDVMLKLADHLLRLRALVVDKLQSPCFGGTNFHVDNHISTDIKNQTITIRGCTVSTENVPGDLPKLTSQSHNSQKCLQSLSTCVQVKNAKSILPGGILEIPLSLLRLVGKLPLCLLHFIM